MVSKTDFKDLLKKFPKEQQSAILETIKAAENIFPRSERTIAWGMPTLRIGEDNLCHVMGFKNHNSLFPSSGAIASQFNKELSKYVVSKGTIHFELEKSFPKPLLKKILLARLEQINESYPKKNGLFVEYYKNGGIKAKGKYKGKNMHGAWEFYRMDGTLIRSGAFKDGKQTGIWITFNSNGKKVKETNF